MTPPAVLTKIRFFVVNFFKRESYIGSIEILLFLGSIITAIEWLIFSNQLLEPYTIILASLGGILDVIKRIIKSPKLPRLSFTEATLSSSKESSFFIGATLTNLGDALNISQKENKGIFIVIYDNAHSTKSQLNYALGSFTQYELTKRLINDYFIQAILPSDFKGIQKYIPKAYHMEKCLLVVLDRMGNIIRQEGVYANGDEGLKRVREDIEKLNPKIN
jgi:hypothetical protein